MNMKKFATAFALTAGTYLAATVAAQADCRVTNADQRGLFGAKTYTRTFSGDSARTIWERYCKPFIQTTIAQNNIRNGEFGMHCTGRLSCSISGRIVNGRVVNTRLDFGSEGSDRVSAEPVERRTTTTRREVVVAPTEEIVRPRRRPTCSERTVDTPVGERSARAAFPCPSTTVTATEEAPARRRTVTTGTNIFNDRGWAAFDQMVIDCETRKRGGTVAAARPRCN